MSLCLLTKAQTKIANTLLEQRTIVEGTIENLMAMNDEYLHSIKYITIIIIIVLVTLPLGYSLKVVTTVHMKKSNLIQDL